MENLFWIGFVGALVAGLFAWMQAKRVLNYSEGTEKMQKIAASIRAGANAYLKQQYTTVFKVFLVVFIILLVIATVADNLRYASYRQRYYGVVNPPVMPRRKRKPKDPPGKGV